MNVYCVQIVWLNIIPTAAPLKMTSIEHYDAKRSYGFCHEKKIDAHQIF